MDTKITDDEKDMFKRSDNYQVFTLIVILYGINEI